MSATAATVLDILVMLSIAIISGILFAIAFLNYMSAVTMDSLRLTLLCLRFLISRCIYIYSNIVGKAASGLGILYATGNPNTLFVLAGDNLPDFVPPHFSAKCLS